MVRFRQQTLMLFWKLAIRVKRNGKMHSSCLSAWCGLEKSGKVGCLLMDEESESTMGGNKLTLHWCSNASKPSANMHRQVEVSCHQDTLLLLLLLQQVLVFVYHTIEIIVMVWVLQNLAIMPSDPKVKQRLPICGRDRNYPIVRFMF